MNIFMRLFMRLHIIVYRATRGRVGGKIGKSPILLLTVIGRRSGKRYTAPLMFVRDGSDYIIVASVLGAPKHPAWFLNLQANPAATIQVLGQQISVEATEAQGQERQQLWDKLLITAPFLAYHAQKTERTIPVVRLQPV